MDIEYIIFDAMGVLFPVGDDTNDLLVPFVQARNPAITLEEINALYLEASLGQISSEDFWRACHITSSTPEALEYAYLDLSLELDASFIAVAETLISNGFRLAMLSNDVSEWSAFLRQKFGLNDLIEMAVISGDVGMRKPDQRIYQHLLDKLKCKPENCLFIDDRVKNLLPARELGIKIIRFSREPHMENRGIREITCFNDLLHIL